MEQIVEGEIRKMVPENPRFCSKCKGLLDPNTGACRKCELNERRCSNCKRLLKSPSGKNLHEKDCRERR